MGQASETQGRYQQVSELLAQPPSGLADSMSRQTAMYANTRWRKRRAEQLRVEPLCRYCRFVGKAVAATVADHITPHKGDPVLFEGPLQSLCHPCHVKVKRLEEEGKGMIGGDSKGNPIDPNHHWNRT